MTSKQNLYFLIDNEMYYTNIGLHLACFGNSAELNYFPTRKMNLVGMFCDFRRFLSGSHNIYIKTKPIFSDRQ